MINIYNEDCLPAMRAMPDKSFDLAIVDPPYGINATNMRMGHAPNRKGNGQYPGESTAVKLKKGRLSSGGGELKDRKLNRLNCDWDFKRPSPEYFSELFRVSKHQIIWGGNYFDLPATRCVICWDKMQSWENFSQFELAWTSFDKPAAMFRISNTGGANVEPKIHPTQKPVELYKQILKRFAKPGYKILDTHLGSGSHAIACYDIGFELEAYETDSSYYTASIEWLKKRIMKYGPASENPIDPERQYKLV